MKKYLFSILAVVLVVIGTAFIKNNSTAPPQKSETAPVKTDEPAQSCVWLQFIGTATDEASTKKCNNWVEFSGNPLTLCNNVNERACAICVTTSALQGTAPNRYLIGTYEGPTTAAIFFNYYMPGNTWYVMAGPGSDALQVRNRN